MIYLIDDDKSVRRGFELFFKSEGMDFLSIEVAKDFFLQYKPAKSDLLLLDLNLPEMNGIEVLEKLICQNIKIPVIVITALDDPQSREICKKHGVNAYLRKPVDGNALIDTIKYILMSVYPKQE